MSFPSIPSFLIKGVPDSFDARKFNTTDSIKLAEKMVAQWRDLQNRSVKVVALAAFAGFASIFMLSQEIKSVLFLGAVGTFVGVRLLELKDQVEGWEEIHSNECQPFDPIGPFPTQYGEDVEDDSYDQVVIPSSSNVLRPAGKPSALSSKSKPNRKISFHPEVDRCEEIKHRIAHRSDLQEPI